MEKGDASIAAAEQELTNLGDRRKIFLAEIELEKEAALLKESGGAADDLEVVKTGTESLPDVIRRVYLENRKRAKKFDTESPVGGVAPATSALAAAAAAMMRIPPDEQPAVALVVNRFAKFRPMLTRQLWHWKKHDQRLQISLTLKYSRLHRQWLKSLANHNKKDKVVQQERRRRACFEQSFPEEHRIEQRFEVQQQRAVSRGDEALQQALRESLKMAGGPQPNASEETFHGHVAMCPPMLVGSAARLAVSINDKNGLVAESMIEHVELERINVWTAEEESVFFEYYMKHPKNFGRIASHLPNKSCADCVKFYYRTKKHNEYKKKERERREEIKKMRRERMILARKRQQEKANDYKTFMENGQSGGSGTDGDEPRSPLPQATKPASSSRLL
jgi:hypothetical protein